MQQEFKDIHVLLWH